MYIGLSRLIILAPRCETSQLRQLQVVFLWKFASATPARSRPGAWLSRDRQTRLILAVLCAVLSFTFWNLLNLSSVPIKFWQVKLSEVFKNVLNHIQKWTYFKSSVTKNPNMQTTHKLNFWFKTYNRSKFESSKKKSTRDGAEPPHLRATNRLRCFCLDEEATLLSLVYSQCFRIWAAFLPCARF